MARVGRKFSFYVLICLFAACSIVSAWGYTVSSVAAGSYHGVAVRSDDTVWTWGSSVNSSMPVQATGITEVIAVSAGYNYTIALRSDGTVWPGEITTAVSSVTAPQHIVQVQCKSPASLESFQWRPDSIIPLLSKATALSGLGVKTTSVSSVMAQLQTV